MEDESEIQLQRVDAAHVANRRISAISNLLMGQSRGNELETEDLRVVAQLIYREAEVVGECLNHFSEAVKMNLRANH